MEREKYRVSSCWLEDKEREGELEERTSVDVAALLASKAAAKALISSFVAPANLVLISVESRSRPLYQLSEERL